MRIVIVRASIILLALTAGFLAGRYRPVRYPVTLTSLSPDDRLQVQLVEVERQFQIDQNFQVRLLHLDSGEARVVFRSPDEGRPIGSERVVWSTDSSRFLLVGRHFYAADTARLPTGETAYLMMDVVTGQIWCNATQQSEFRGFGVTDLLAVKWHEWPLDAEPSDRGELR